jgi:hypothetical protein
MGSSLMQERSKHIEYEKIDKIGELLYENCEGQPATLKGKLLTFFAGWCE